MASLATARSIPPPVTCTEPPLRVLLFSFDSATTLPESTMAPTV